MRKTENVGVNRLQGLFNFNKNRWSDRYDHHIQADQKEILVMKKQAINTFVLLGLITLSAISANAQSQLIISKVKIPFDFSIRDKTLPAGTYSVARALQDKSFLLIRSEDGKSGIMSGTVAVEAKEKLETAKLIFRRYGQTYFLFQIWEPHSNYGLKFPKSRSERSIEREMLKRGARPLIRALVVPAS